MKEWRPHYYWPLRDNTRSASAIQFPPPPPTTTMVPNKRGLVIVDTRSGLVFEQLVCTIIYILYIDEARTNSV